VELAALVPTPGISVLEPEFDRVDELFARWWSRHGSTLGAVLRPRPASRSYLT
jgi:hypothetical protein